jgi:hypothetical protein
MNLRPAPFWWLATLANIGSNDMNILPSSTLTSWPRWLVPAIYAACLTAFIIDITSTDTLAFGVFYIPLVATALFYRDKRAEWVLATIACVMVFIGTFIPSIDPDILGLALNRALSVCVVLGTAIFVQHVRSIEDKLAEQSGCCGTSHVRSTD